MERSNLILWIGIIGLVLYAISTIDWKTVMDIVQKVAIVLIGGAVIWAISKMSER